MKRVVKLTVSVVLKMIWPYYMIRVGKHISRQRINRLMKAEGIVCKTRRRFKATTNSRHNKPVADNTLDRDFQREQPNQAYVGDITYVPTREGWLYLSVFIDVCSRAVVGWSMSGRMTATTGDGLAGNGAVEA